MWSTLIEAAKLVYTTVGMAILIVLALIACLAFPPIGLLAVIGVLFALG